MAGLWRMRGGRMPVGHGVLLRTHRNGRDERGVHGALPVSVCVRWAAAGCADAPRSADKGRAAPAGPLRGTGSATAVPDAVSWPGVHDSQSCVTDGGHAAGAAGGSGRSVYGRAAGLGRLVGAVRIVLGGAHGRAGAGEPSLHGDLMVVASLCISIAWVLLSKKLMETHSPPVVTAYTLVAGTVMLAAWILTPRLVIGWIPNHSAPMPFAHISAKTWGALAASGLACTATTTLLWNWGIHQVPASRAGVFLNIEPALGSLLGVELLGERLGPYAWLGGALIFGA